MKKKHPTEPSEYLILIPFAYYWQFLYYCFSILVVFLLPQTHLPVFRLSSLIGS